MKQRLAILLLILMSACSPSDRAFPESLTNDADLRAAIIKSVPIGSSVTDAQGRLEADGFHCVHQWHAPLGARQDLIYLYCRRDEGRFVSTRHRDVFVMIQGVIVDDIRVSSGT